MNTNALRVIVAFVVTMGFLLPHAGIVAADLTGGGEVTNTAPVVHAITITTYDNQGTETGYQTSGGSPTTELNDDGADYIEVNVTVYDANGESDLEWINFTITEGNSLGADGTSWMNHEISSTDRSNSSEPAFTENEIHGWDNGTADNGYLTFNFKHTYDNDNDPVNGALTSSTYTWQAEIKDGAGSTATDSSAVDVYNYADLTVTESYFESDGTENASTIWGNWSGSTGTDQAGTTYIKATNAGSTGTGETAVAWNSQNLENTTSGGTIALTNVEYYEGEAANPATVGSWTHLSTNATHMKAWTNITHSTGGTTTSWTNYTVSIPAATPQGNYSETFTWTAT